MFHASCLDYFCQGNLIGRERATAEGGLVQSKNSAAEINYFLPSWTNVFFVFY